MAVLEQQAPSSTAVPGIVRASAILREVARRDGQIGSGIAANLNLAKSTTADVCAALVEHQLLTRDSLGAYHLGAVVDRLASTWVGGGTALRRFARVCDEESGLAGVTMAMYVPVGESVMCMAVRLGTRPLAQTPRAGIREPLTGSAPGRELLRAMPRADLEELLQLTAAFDGVDVIEYQEQFTTMMASQEDEPGVVAAGQIAAGKWIAVQAHVPEDMDQARIQVIREDVRAVVAILISEARADDHGRTSRGNV